MIRVQTYIDGFNLYYGMTESWNDTKWLDIYSLSISLIRANQRLECVKYFTSRISNNAQKEYRQRVYLEALQQQGVCLIFGKYETNKVRCSKCNYTRKEPKEKMTDVNIATQILEDAYADKYDIALLISGDSDLVPPVKSVLKNFPNKKIIVVFPPNRKSKELAKVASASFTLGRKLLKDNQLPDIIVKSDGYNLQKPVQW